MRSRPRLLLSPSKHQKRMEKRMDNEKTQKEYNNLKIRYDALKKMYETSENNLDNANKQLFVEKLKSNRLSQEIIALKKDNQQKIDEMVNEQKQKIKEMEKGYENDINSLKNTNEDERIALKLQQQKSLYDAHINLIRKDFSDQLKYHEVIEKQHKQIIFELQNHKKIIRDTYISLCSLQMVGDERKLNDNRIYKLLGINDKKYQRGFVGFNRMFFFYFFVYTVFIFIFLCIPFLFLLFFFGKLI